MDAANSACCLPYTNPSGIEGRDEPHPDTALPTSVEIVGAGPTGLSLALGLARDGVRSEILEQKPTTSRTYKAPGLHVRARYDEELAPGLRSK